MINKKTVINAARFMRLCESLRWNNVDVLYITNNDALIETKLLAEELVSEGIDLNEICEYWKDFPSTLK